MRSRRRRGAVLIEPLVALAILGLAGAGWVTLLAETRATAATVHRVERETERAATLLSGLAREPRRALVARVGRRRIGAHEVRISQRDDALFSIEIAAPGGAPLLSTVVYRPAEGDDVR